ncbi:MAG TPA: crosslink repair DNA glycosylase YcaQ family protein [Bauldia sp.]|nr:crosslink repair DNA glycosylase YcaQ family protein [Bauldia sp.]
MPAAAVPPKVSLSNDEARRIALAAQGFTRRKTAGRSPWPVVADTIADIGFLQLDSVNVLVRSHYLPVFSRAGDYDRTALDRHGFALGKSGQRTLFEYWAHEASLLPLELHPLLRWRMDRARRLIGHTAARAKAHREMRAYYRAILKEVERRGPLAASELEDPGERSGPWWGWHRGKGALERLFHTGEVTAAGRRGGFERVYDIPERVIPPAILSLPTPSERDAIRELAARGARAFGVATETDIRDYFRLPIPEARRAIAELTEEGTLIPAAVQGWDKPAYLAAGSETPARVTASALLSPFDPLVWFRPRTERVFDFHYRIEIYTPQAKRRFGYYVLPFLHRGRLKARIDLKAEREASTLAVRGAHAEQGADRDGLAPDLAAELRRMAGWLGLRNMRVDRNGDLAEVLAKNV